MGWVWFWFGLGWVLVWFGLVMRVEASAGTYESIVVEDEEKVGGAALGEV